MSPTDEGHNAPRHHNAVTSTAGATMIDAIFSLLAKAIDDYADDEVCKHLAAAWCVAHYDGDGYVDADTAHRTYVAAYYGRRSLVPVGDSYLTDNPSEVSVPEWAQNYTPLLRLLARRERQHDEAALRWYAAAQRE